MHYFTSITSNYLPKARVLARSVKRHNHDAVFHLVLSDIPPHDFNLDDEPFDSLLTVQDLGIPDLDSWIFRHSVVELCTAVKGSAFLKIFETTTARKVIYFDPDIAVLHGLEELDALLDTFSVVLTPHQVEPDTEMEAIMDNEVCSLRHGVYNLGFLAVRGSEEGLALLRWWRDRLLELCYDDIPGGLFTDQRWMDLAPAFFTDLHILRDKTCNVATWNLTHRLVSGDPPTGLRIDGRPLKFYHFSGFDSGDQKTMLTKYAADNQALFGLRNWYAEELRRTGQEELGAIPCAYGFFSNGEPITGPQRMLYRSRVDLIQAFPTPAVISEDRWCYYWWYKDHVEAAQRDVTPRERELLEKEQVLDLILNSKSWKLTKPLRFLGQFFVK